MSIFDDGFSKSPFRAVISCKGGSTCNEHSVERKCDADLCVGVASIKCREDEFEQIKTILIFASYPIISVSDVSEKHKTSIFRVTAE